MAGRRSTPSAPRCRWRLDLGSSDLHGEALTQPDTDAHSRGACALRNKHGNFSLRHVQRRNGCERLRAMQMRPRIGAHMAHERPMTRQLQSSCAERVRQPFNCCNVSESSAKQGRRTFFIFSCAANDPARVVACRAACRRIAGAYASQICRTKPLRVSVALAAAETGTKPNFGQNETMGVSSAESIKEESDL